MTATIETLVQALADGGVEALVGVPDSTLPGLGDAWARRGAAHVIAANEGGAVAIAAGYALGGSLAAVYLQNTGLGVAIDAFGSLVGPDVLAVPMLWIVGWRGHPELDDVPHHRWHGEHGEAICSQAGLEPVRVPRGAEALRRSVLVACTRLHRERRSYALLISPGTFAAPAAPRATGFGRIEAILAIAQAAGPTARIVAGAGYTGRALALVRARLGHDVDDVLAGGGMGHAAALALGLACAQPERRVVCLDGDGALAMHLGAAPVVAARAPTSFVHVILDNGCHESAGGDPTPLLGTDLPALARALGYPRVASVASADELAAVLRSHEAGPMLLRVRIEPHVDPPPPRPAPAHAEPATPRGSVVGPRLFTPGPGRLTPTVRRALGVEVGSRSPTMMRCISAVRRMLVAMVADDRYECIPLAGSATTALDALLGSVLPPRRRIVVVVAGRYGERIATVAARWGHEVVPLAGPLDRPFSASRLDAALASEGPVDWLAFVHGETSTGVLHPVAELAAVARRRGIPVLLDAVATLGASELSLSELGIELAFASAAKGLEGPAGLGLVLARREHLESAPHGLSTTLDVAAQWRRLEDDGQFPFTPPTNGLLGLWAALEELASNGGPLAREGRYRMLGHALVEGLAPLGLHATIEPAHRLPLVLAMESRHGPIAPLVSALRRDGIEIYPAADAREARFRLGLVGVTEDDVEALLRSVARHLPPLSAP